MKEKEVEIAKINAKAEKEKEVEIARINAETEKEKEITIARINAEKEMIINYQKNYLIYHLFANGYIKPIQLQINNNLGKSAATY